MATYKIHGFELKEYRQFRRDFGLCATCGKENDRPGKWHCSVCLEKYNSIKIANAYRKKNEGVCHNCGEQLDRDGWLCSECTKLSNKKAFERGQLRRQLGLCPQCGNPANAEYIYCQRCRDLKKEWLKNKEEGVPVYKRGVRVELQAKKGVLTS